MHLNIHSDPERKIRANWHRINFAFSSTLFISTRSLRPTPVTEAPGGAHVNSVVAHVNTGVMASEGMMPDVEMVQNLMRKPVKRRPRLQNRNSFEFLQNNIEAEEKHNRVSRNLRTVKCRGKRLKHAQEAAARAAGFSSGARKSG